MLKSRKKNHVQIQGKKKKRQVEEFPVSGTVSAKALQQDVLNVTRNRQEAPWGLVSQEIRYERGKSPVQSGGIWRPQQRSLNFMLRIMERNQLLESPTVKYPSQSKEYIQVYIYVMFNE